MNNMFSHLSAFTKARLILSAWYTLILFLILVAFSIALLTTYSNDVTRIVLRQDFGNRVPKTLSRTELRLVVAQVRELRARSRLDIIVIDAIALVIGGGLSFFLAGKTLKPIQKTLASQKIFVADASHELKSPITTIQSACEVALRSTNKTKEDYKEVLTQVHEQTLRLGRLVNDLLALSVLDAGTLKSMEKCSLTGIVEKELSTMKPVFEKAKITLERSIKNDVYIQADSDKIHQLIVILLDNALKYTPTGGKVFVKVEAKPSPQLIVKDSGIGIAQDKQKAIFRRFFQADSSHSGKGAGLGLAIAESIMQLHKGRISVESSLGKGSTFTCIFQSV